jgi:hypothetical protein
MMRLYSEKGRQDRSLPHSPAIFKIPRVDNKYVDRTPEFRKSPGNNSGSLGIGQICLDRNMLLRSVRVTP